MLAHHTTQAKQILESLGCLGVGSLYPTCDSEFVNCTQSATSWTENLCENCLDKLASVCLVCMPLLVASFPRLGS